MGKRGGGGRGENEGERISTSEMASLSLRTVQDCSALMVTGFSSSPAATFTTSTFRLRPVSGGERLDTLTLPPICNNLHCCKA